MEKLKLDIKMFSETEETDQYYVHSASHAKHPAYNKDEVDALLSPMNTSISNLNANKQNNVLSGTDTPSSSLGNDGDIYLQYV